MLRAAHYKADAVDGPGAGRSPPKHRTGGILDLALTAADKYALSLLPTALKGTGLASNDGPATDARAAPQHPPNGIPPAFKMHRPPGNPALHNTPAPSQEPQLQPTVDSRVATSWDTSLKEILAALEPESRTLKPAKLRDYKYPNQNHGMPTNTAIPSPLRELDEALITLPGGTRRNKSSVPAYAAALKGFSRQSRRPDLQGASHPAPLQTVDVQYDLVPSVKLAWAGPGNGTYSTTGFGGTPKKYTSQLVGRVSPHYSGTPALQQSMSTPAGNQDPLHLPEIPNNSGYGAAHQLSSFKAAGNYTLPSYQTWAHSAAPGSTAGSAANSRRALPYVSTNAPSLAKPLTVQYHPVLKSPSLGAGPVSVYSQPVGSSPVSRGTPQRPATDHGSSLQQGVGGSPGDSAKLYPRSNGNQPHRLPQTPPEVAAEVARLRHAQELDGVLNGLRSDLMQAAAPRLDVPKSKFLQMYEDPNRPLTKLNPKHLLGNVAPASQHHRRHRPPNIQTDKQQPSADGGPPSSSGGVSRSPMYERRLRPLPGDVQLGEEGAAAGSAAQTGDGAVGADTLHNVHLQPPEIPDGTIGDEASLEMAAEATSAGRSTPRSSQLEREDTTLTVADFRPPEESDGGAVGPGGVGEGEAEAGEADEPGAAAETIEAQCLSGDAPAEGAMDAPGVSEAAPELGLGQPGTVGVEAEREPAAMQVVLERTEPAGLGEQEVDRNIADVAAGPPESEQQVEEVQSPEATSGADAEVAASCQDGPEAPPVEAPAKAGAAGDVLVEREGVKSPASSPSEILADVAAPCAAPVAPTTAEPLMASGAGDGPEESQEPEESNSGQPCADASVADASAAESMTTPEMEPTTSSASAGDAEADEQTACAEPAGTEAQDAACSGDEPVTSVVPESGTAAVDNSPEASLPTPDQDNQGVNAVAGPSVELEPLADGVGADPQPSNAEGAAPAGEAPPAEGASYGEDANPSAPAQEMDGVAASQPEQEAPSVASVDVDTEAGEPPAAGAAEVQPPAEAVPAEGETTAQAEALPPQDAQPRTSETAGPLEAEAAGPVADQPSYSLPPGVTPEMARVSAVRIQSHARGFHARRRLAAMRKECDAARAAQASGPVPSSPARKQVAYELPPGVTPEVARAAVVRIQSHARGYFARRHVADLRRGREAGETALATAVTAVTMRKLESYELPSGVTAEMAEAAAIRVQAHMRGHLARRHVRRMRAECTPAPAAAPEEATVESPPKPEPEAACGEPVERGPVEQECVEQGPAEQGHVEQECVEQGPAEQGPVEQECVEQGPAEQGPVADTDTALRETGDAVSTGGAAEVSPPPQALPAEPEEMTIDALKAALADDDEETEEVPGELSDAALVEAPESEGAAAIDASDPAAVAAAAAAAAAASKGTAAPLDDGAADDGGVADTTAAVDQATAEASMARLVATSARTSAMFQGAGAELRYSDDEASALELMDNLDSLMQGDDEAAAAAAAVAAATALADGEIVSISADGVSEPQSLGVAAAANTTNPMDVTEPGGVRVLAGKYEVQHVVGEGAYGMVMKCKVRGTEPVLWVAIKEFKIDDNDPDAEDVKRTSLREVAVLEALQHPHVVGFVDKFMVGDRLFIVMEFLPCNLLELLEAQPGGMDRDAVRLIMFQLCSAIAFIHSKGMVYRDIKPENLLVDEHGTVKLCDFGFARYLPSRPSSHLTDYVATRWYRAPELLLGPPYRDALGKHVQYIYGAPVDMWAVGCLMGELLDGEPLFAGDSDLDQLYRVQQILGPMAPTQQYMFYANPHNTGIVFNIKQPMTLASRYRGKVSDVELSFMIGLLEMDPDKRLTGEQCLQHPYLVDLAAAANALPTPTPTDSNAPSATNMSLDGGNCSTQEGEQQPLKAGDVYTSGAGDAPDGTVQAVVMMPAPRMSESREGLGSRGIEKAGSLTRAAGSLTRGGRSLSRVGSVSPVMMQPVSSSPGPGAAPQRAASKLQASESGQVVIVEGVEEEDEEEAKDRRGMAAVKSISALAAVVSEIEPAEEP